MRVLGVILLGCTLLLPAISSNSQSAEDHRHHYSEQAQSEPTDRRADPQCKYGGVYDRATGRCNCFDVACTHEAQPLPVCGSNGKKYPSRCAMKVAACLTQQPIHSVGHPPCDPSETGLDRCKYGGVYDAETGRCDCRRISCPHTLHPVCGSDRTQYDSECAMKVAACLTQQPIHSVGHPPCDSSDTDPIGEYCKSEEAKVISSSAIVRLNFAGRFLADVSTYNNNRTNFNISTFDPQRDPEWNPKGTNDFRLVNCYVTQVCLADGTCSTLDKTVGKRIIGSDSTTTGKLVDLDTDDQTQSQIWGLQVGVDGFFKGDFTPRSFNHMHDACEGLKCPTVSGMTRFSAIFFSTLQNVQWVEESLSEHSEFVKQVMSLRCKPGFQLHIKLNVYNMIVVSESPDFPYGRVTGTIFAKVSETPHPYGPYNRMLWDPSGTGGRHVPFYVDSKRNKVVLDFANSMTFDIRGNVVGPSGGSLYLTQCKPLPKLTLCELLEEAYNLGQINLGRNDWFNVTAGIVELSVNPKAIESTQLVVIQQKTPTHCERLVEERQDGLFVQAIDDRVARKEPDEEWQMQFRTFRFGRLAKEVFIRPIQTRPNKTRQHAITIDSTEPSSDNGILTIKFKSEDPGEPRKEQQLDGQVYMYDIMAKMGDDGSEFTVLDLTVAVHLFSQYTFTEGEVTWYEHVYPIFQQYANLYPSMKQIINLASYDDVKWKMKLLKHALNLPEKDPNYMPVTRDLSKNKRRMILSWLDDPKLGTPTNTLEELKKTLQIALQIELSTIPPYLSALFSIKHGENIEVAALIKSVVVDEMKHMTLASNILNAIGGSPNLNISSIVPSYPGPLPGGANPGLVLKLAKCSLNQIRTVFQGIERPNCEMVDSDVVEYLRINKKRVMKYKSGKPEGNTVQDILKHCQKITSSTLTPQTIGAIYMIQILCPMAQLERNLQKNGNTLFTGDITKQITYRQWLGHYHDSPFAVSDFDSAVDAITIIASEGEGSDPCHPFDVETNKLSHYSKFAEMVHGRKLMETGQQNEPWAPYFENFTPCDEEVKSCKMTFGFVGRKVPFFEDGVWPTISNPRTKSYPPGSQARKYSDNFNMVYTGLLQCLHEAYNGAPQKLKCDCMGMMSSLTAWGKRLVQTPIDPNGDPEIGPNAAPTFEFTLLSTP
ncbi:PREDICTED: uncharacterized protein LOC109488316 isoform X2 [Branchiostoma belcheri]|uniref:Uncharacterized protein LOC109488316 isoform X2 n=1 Tax=Branchiostoma belcheri TaxID=7741 RepID=A0A6P5B0L9_BRABE|nr:PREDICTED: uncharacterized protein LOC109488316 isoform X2 [Branchiostoma belcheri]